MNDRERDLEAIRETYRRYRSGGRARLWDLGNPGYARIARDRDRALVALLRLSVSSPGGRVLDLGCGEGGLADVARAAALPIATWVGADLDPEAIVAARAAMPWATFVEASADHLPFAENGFDVVVASTLFSSLPSQELERAVAAEIGRVLAPGGWLVWYDLRYRNPANPAVHAMTKARIRGLFPGWMVGLHSMTLLPPLARRLGEAQSLYGLLNSVPFLRSHLIGRLRPR